MVMILQRPNRKIAIVYIHLEPYKANQTNVRDIWALALTCGLFPREHTRTTKIMPM